MRIIYSKACPNCKGDLRDDRALKGLPCESCYPFDKIIESELKKRAKLLKNFFLIKDRAGEFSKFFKKVLRNEINAYQKSWIKRALSGDSFSIVAPTGIGKTTFLMLYSLFSGKKTYFIVPTKVLGKQTYEKLLEFAEKGNTKRRIVFYSSDLKKKEKDEAKKKIEKEEYDILITTSSFLQRNKNLGSFDLVVVDDVDSFLKREGNVYLSLRLLGIEKEEIRKAESIHYWELRRNFKKVEELKKELKKPKGQIILSSATSKPRARNLYLYRILLGFTVGGKSTLRNIFDLYTEEYKMEALKKTLSQLKDGILLLAPSREKYEELKESLSDYKISNQDEKDAVEKFKDRETNILLGIANYYSPFVRGLDLPERIKFVIFYGVPKIEIPLNFEKMNKNQLFLFLLRIRKIKDTSTLLKELRRANEEKLKEIKKKAKELFEEVKNKVLEDEELEIKEKDGEYYFVFGDVSTYIQGSGRCSRLYKNEILKGLSVVFVDDKKAFNFLKRRIRLYNEDILFKKIEVEEVGKYKKEVEEERKKVEKEKKGLKFEVGLVIVESPTKAKTIASFFGTPAKRIKGRLVFYETSIKGKNLYIVATQGHLFDLATKVGYYGIFKKEKVGYYDTIKKKGNKQIVDEDDEYDYDKREIIETLREISKEVDVIYVSTDPDTEGEKIAYDISCMLSFFSKTKRIEFHEVTKRAFLEALENKKEVNKNLVDAQLVRRFADRLIGFELSKKLKEKFKDPNLSAGRVQTPVLGWIIERAKLYKKKEDIFIIEVGDKTIKTKEKLKEGVYDLEILEKKEEIEKINPPPPYNTPQLLKDLSRFKIPSKKGMDILQNLFENGLITYHRTDSVRVSEKGREVAKELCSKNNLSFYPREWSKEGAHECIRPSKPITPEELEDLSLEGVYDLKKEERFVYSVIYRRFLASQMPPAKVKKIKWKIKIANYTFDVETIEEIIEKGFSEIIRLQTQKIEQKAKVTKKKVPLAYPFREGELIEEMQKKGLGRPSTYAKIISTLFERGYVMRIKDFLIPTKKGMTAYEFLKRYKELVSEETTRELEKKMDEIAEGKEKYEEVLEEIFDKIEKTVHS